MSERVESWWASGSTVRVETSDGGPFELFIRVAGSGPTVTLLHGYPSSSFDWQAVSEGLQQEYRVIAIDLLGFGRSDKPWPHGYSIIEQADLVDQVLSVLGVESTHLVVHDYSSSVGQELTGRGGDPRFDSITYLNGAVYPKLHRPTEGQLLLRGPGGNEFAQAIDANLFASSIRATFGTGSPLPDEIIDDMWFTISHDGGQQLAGGLLHYMDDRATHGDRWVHTMEQTKIPTTFIWGPHDPVSGTHMLTEIRSRMPGTRVFELEGVGHWPMLEDPESVKAAIITTLELAD